jgi:hypothetical protein
MTNSDPRTATASPRKLKLKWSKTADGWVVLGANFSARVGDPGGPLGFSHWSVYHGNERGGSGGTSSVLHSKREAEREVERLTTWLLAKAKGAP